MLHYIDLGLLAHFVCATCTAQGDDRHRIKAKVNNFSALDIARVDESKVSMIVGEVVGNRVSL